MTVLQVIWLASAALAASWLSLVALLNPLAMALPGPVMRQLGGRYYMLLTLACLLVHVGVAILLGATLSLEIAIASVSVLGQVWGLFSYFLLQRFALPIDRPSFVGRLPTLLPTMCLALLVSGSLAFWLVADWWVAAVPLLVWLLCGFVCTELAIRRLVHRPGLENPTCDRQAAVFSLNLHQGRDPFSCERYPFP